MGLDTVALDCSDCLDELQYCRRFSWFICLNGLNGFILDDSNGLDGSGGSVGCDGFRFLKWLS